MSSQAHLDFIAIQQQQQQDGIFIWGDGKGLTVQG